MEHFGEDKLTIQTARPRDSRFEPSVSNVSKYIPTTAENTFDTAFVALLVFTDYIHVSSIFESILGLVPDQRVLFCIGYNYSKIKNRDFRTFAVTEGMQSSNDTQELAAAYAEWLGREVTLRELKIVWQSIFRFLDYLISHRSKQKIERKKPFLQNDSEDHTIVNEQWVDYILVTIAEFWNKRLKWKAVVRLLDSDNWTEVAGAYSLMVHECSASTLKNNCKKRDFSQYQNSSPRHCPNSATLLLQNVPGQMPLQSMQVLSLQVRTTEQFCDFLLTTISSHTISHKAGNQASPQESASKAKSANIVALQQPLRSNADLYYETPTHFSGSQTFLSGEGQEEMARYTGNPVVGGWINDRSLKKSKVEKRHDSATLRGTPIRKRLPKSHVALPRLWDFLPEYLHKTPCSNDLTEPVSRPNTIT